MLELVGLTERADDRVKAYSLGMRQRLAIAAAMLKAPELLILDEPTNGLDPAGMVEVRELVRNLGADGRTTVFLSSHLLAEVEAVCDAVTILRRGRLVASGAVGEVLAMSGARSLLSVRIAEAERAAQVLAASGVAATLQAPDQLRRRLALRRARERAAGCPGPLGQRDHPRQAGPGTCLPRPHRGGARRPGPRRPGPQRSRGRRP